MFTSTPTPSHIPPQAAHLTVTNHVDGKSPLWRPKTQSRWSRPVGCLRQEHPQLHNHVVHWLDATTCLSINLQNPWQISGDISVATRGRAHTNWKQRVLYSSATNSAISFCSPLNPPPQKWPTPTLLPPTTCLLTYSNTPCFYPIFTPDPTFQIGEGVFCTCAVHRELRDVSCPSHTLQSPHSGHRDRPSLSLLCRSSTIYWYSIRMARLTLFHTAGPVISRNFWTLLLLKGQELMESTRVKNKMVQNWNKCWQWTWKTSQWNVKWIRGYHERCDILLPLRYIAREMYRTGS
jgi:hypothetical protein